MTDQEREERRKRWRAYWYRTRTTAATDACARWDSVEERLASIETYAERDPTIHGYIAWAFARYRPYVGKHRRRAADGASGGGLLVLRRDVKDEDGKDVTKKAPKGDRTRCLKMIDKLRKGGAYIQTVIKEEQPDETASRI